jgi:hypothetical protein
MRNVGDYGTLHAVTAAQTELQTTRAEQFLDQAERVLGPIPPRGAVGTGTSTLDNE